MQELKSKQSLYIVKPIDAIITSNTMIPGLNGQKINMQKSYQKMRKINTFQESLLVYDTIYPNKSIKNNYHKVIISGNKTKKEISIILAIDDDNMLKSLNQIIKDYHLSLDILVSNNYSNSNTNYKNILATQYYPFIDYCLTYNLKINKQCQKKRKYTILGFYINNHYLTKTKEQLQNGSILVYSFNHSNYHNLAIILKYILNNNYRIVPINMLISERID